MTKIVLDITTSLDGYVTAPNPGPGQGLGEDGMILHDWVFAARTDADQAILDASFRETGAVVMGRNLFDVVDAPGGWGEELNYGADAGGASPQPPCFVVTHTQPDHVRLASRFTIVTDGLPSAIEQARAAAGDKDVVVMGGGDVIGQCLAEGLGDELRLHLAPLVLGGGSPLWHHLAGRRVVLEPLDVTPTPGATHLRYSISRDPAA